MRADTRIGLQVKCQLLLPCGRL